MYSGTVVLPGTAADDLFVPEAWDTTLRDRKMYEHVIAPYCRGCHASFESSASTLSDPQLLSNIGPFLQDIVCARNSSESQHAMPNAEAVMNRFWSGPARAYLVDYARIYGSCAP
jgi:hypothetical protein